MLAYFVTDSVTPDLSSLRLETTAAVAGVGSKQVSSLTSIFNAMLTPLDSTDSSVLGSGSLVAGLLNDNNMSFNFVRVFTAMSGDIGCNIIVLGEEDF